MGLQPGYGDLIWLTPKVLGNALPKRRGGGRRSKPIEITSNLQVSNSIYPWERVILESAIPVLVPVIEGLIRDAEAIQAEEEQERE